ncbi:MAG: TldD/PmbA family protein [Elusimicrobiota bacterium]
MTLVPHADFYAGFLGRGDFADVYLEESSHLAMRWEDQKLEDIVQGSGGGAGLRCLRGRETHYVHADARRPLSDGLDDGEKERFAALAGDLARRLPAVRRKIVWKPAPALVHKVRIHPDAVSLKNKASLMARADKAARVYSMVRQVTVSYGQRVKRVACLNSAGELFVEERIYLVFSVHVTAAKGDLLQTAYEAVGGIEGAEMFERVPPEWAAEIAAKRAIAKLMAPPAPAGELAVVIASEAGGTLIHEAIGHALEADAVQEGASPHFAGKIGKTVASPLVTVVDDPTLPGRRGSFFYDDEGVPARRAVLVDRGVLKDYLYDRRCAKKDGRPSNGRGRRESYAHKPIPRMSNIFIAPGKESPQAIVQSLARGLYVTRMGGGQVNTATGDFVFEVDEGHWVENGRVKHLVRGATLLGNGPEILRSIDRVGSDLGWAIGTCGKDGQGVPVADGVPTLRIPKIIVGGTEKK